MKRIGTILMLLILGICALRGQYAGGRVDVRDVGAELGDKMVTLTFAADVDREAIGADDRVILSPVVTDGRWRVSFPAVIIQGRRAAMSWKRNEWVAKEQAAFGSPVMAGRDETVLYEATVPFQQWMRGADIILECVVEGCGTSRRRPDEVFARNILPVPAPESIIVEREPEHEPSPGPEIFIPATVADTLSLAFSFILPDSEFDEANPVYDDDRENALIVYFELNRSVIAPGYGPNEQTLNNLIAAINAIQEAMDSHVKRVVVAGFASPEGSFRRNDRLAWERAVAVREYIMENTHMDGDLVMLHNGSEDWRGLRMLVEQSRMPSKEEVLSIIDAVPLVSDDGVGKPRLEQIKRLDGGRPYEFMEANFFPRLRNGAFIRVYYGNN